MVLGYSRRRNEDNPDLNSNDSNNGARLLYRYREENIKLAALIKDIKDFTTKFNASEQFSQKELFGMLSTISNVLDNSSWRFQQLDSSISKEKLEQVFTSLTYNAHRVEEILDLLLESINKENYQLSSFIKSKHSFVEVSMQIEKVISQFIHEQDALRQELATLMPNIEKIVTQTDLIETQEVETLATNYITYYYEFEKLLKEQTTDNKELIITLENICLFLRKLLGNLEYLNRSNEDEFLFELGLNEDENLEKVDKTLKNRGITSKAKTNPRKFALNFFRAARGKHITEELLRVKEESSQEQYKVLKTTLNKLTSGISQLKEPVQQRFKEKVDTSKLEQEYWETIGARISQQVINTNNHIKEVIQSLSGFSQKLNKSKFNYIELLFDIPLHNFEDKLHHWNRKVFSSFPTISSQVNLHVEPSLIINPTSGTPFMKIKGVKKQDPQEVQEKLAQLSEEENILYQEIQELNSQLEGGKEEINHLMATISQLSSQPRTAQQDMYGNFQAQEFVHIYDSMRYLFSRVKSIEEHTQKLESQKQESRKQLREIKKQLQKVESEVEKIIIYALGTEIVSEIEHLLLNIEKYYNEAISQKYVQNILSQNEKDSKDKEIKEVWARINRNFSSCFDSFSF